jgi:UDP:flavonoid glycosyltransferase YjiC (YdhE family)
LPLIRRLAAEGREVVIASSGDSLRLLEKEVPSASFLQLPDYGISYGSGNLVFEAMKQMSRVKKVIARENKVVNDFAKSNGIELIISDNRYGVYSRTVKSVLITHQLRLMLPAGFGFLSPVAQKINLRYISFFDEVWVPDYEGANNLSGELSHGTDPGVPVRFIGPQSRFSKVETTDYQFDIAFILSGPEPARTVFEEKIAVMLENFGGKAIMVRGRVEETTPVQYHNCKVVNYMQYDELQRVILESRKVVSRSGYSTIMDLYAMEKGGLLIPTPGQPEQEYLARYHNGKNGFRTVKQKEFRPEMMELLP